jgi:bacteriocin-like protein
MNSDQIRELTDAEELTDDALESISGGKGASIRVQSPFRSPRTRLPRRNPAVVPSPVSLQLPLSPMMVFGVGIELPDARR